mmetsp:Transcript_12051/g.36168  ORF Transcript_12051/g.36168 Transcript_12051/m.36168 type:complete len:398 (-) Transcript_12051:348-1541(-)|eukprot:CAMPEP_0206136082 /NCGR_PEP_ID=MMETSP1473-20131121/1313_1 /ASSEMBLY_ACC=CAM_ASM_001109 /TAXON_ID=1461547 /ORGANISM="Stichococcus sp, Strain RCC1054" /LENGTH=397 /DNA_ID=CAMNT_0053528335 /DNA_START=414 /DNA_END=1607 /DNA_ORIENTATION=+
MPFTFPISSSRHAWHLTLERDGSAAASLSDAAAACSCDAAKQTAVASSRTQHDQRADLAWMFHGLLEGLSASLIASYLPSPTAAWQSQGLYDEATPRDLMGTFFAVLLLSGFVLTQFAKRFSGAQNADAQPHISWPRTCPATVIFANSCAPLKYALSNLDVGLEIKKGSIMVHMEHFDQNEPAHVETMKRALARLSARFPTAGLVLQLGDNFYEHKDGELRPVPWVGSIPPPVVTRMSAIQLPRHGRCVLVEGEHLNIAMSGAQQVLAPDVQAARDIEGAELRAVPDPPLVLYCIESSVLQAEKLRPMFSTPDGKKALFAAPERVLKELTVTLRLRRGHAFSPDVTMTSSWLKESHPATLAKPPQVAPPSSLSQSQMVDNLGRMTISESSTTSHTPN